MNYWNGTSWVVVAATVNEAATLQMISGVPTWTGGTPPNVTNPTTGEIWMDRNLGASQVATSSTDAASYGDLYQWGSPQNTNLWQGVNGVNNPCPSGYRLSTETEWTAERTSWGSNNAAGAFASVLKLPVAGMRAYWNGSLGNVGSYGYYWSSTVVGTYSRVLYLDIPNAYMTGNGRAHVSSVRCLKN